MDASGYEPSDSDARGGGEKSAVRSVADTALPLEVGSIAVGEDGHILHSGDDRPLHFQFSACGILFEADLAHKDAPLRLTANLGKLPYSAESPDGRRLARSVLAATDRLRHGQILLSDEQDMILQGERKPPSPRTPVNVIATAAALIVDFKPYIDLLADAVSIRATATTPEAADAEASDGAEPSAPSQEADS